MLTIVKVFDVFWILSAQNDTLSRISSVFLDVDLLPFLHHQVTIPFLERIIDAHSLYHHQISFAAYQLPKSLF